MTEYEAIQLEIDGLRALVMAIGATETQTLVNSLEGLIEKSASRLNKKLKEVIHDK